jgi:aldehyde:ferredoxin oxidoreductase
MYGWHGRLLRIDLTSKKTSIEEIDPQVSKDFIGGRGVAIRYLYVEVDPGVDPL